MAMMYYLCIINCKKLREQVICHFHKKGFKALKKNYVFFFYYVILLFQKKKKNVFFRAMQLRNVCFPAHHFYAKRWRHQNRKTFR